jgi:hypothetical protein
VKLLAAKDVPHAGWVYFALAGDRIKIGHSKLMAKRMQVLRSSSASGAELLGVIRGDECLEQNIHEKFQGQREHGEWFRDSPALRAFIAKSCDPIEARRAMVAGWAGVRQAP